MARFVKYTDPDGNVMDAILLSPGESGESANLDLVIPLDRGSGVSIPVEATQGTGPGTWAEA